MLERLDDYSWSTSQAHIPARAALWADRGPRWAISTGQMHLWASSFPSVQRPAVCSCACRQRPRCAVAHVALLGK